MQGKTWQKFTVGRVLVGGGRRLWVLVCLVLVARGAGVAMAYQSPRYQDLKLPPGHDEPVVFEHLKMRWAYAAGEAPEGGLDESRRQMLREACQHLGTRLSRGQGPWGLGVVLSFECLWGDERLFGHDGDDEVSWSLDVEMGKAAWRLRLRRDADAAGADDDALSPAFLSTLVAELGFKASPHSLTIMAKDQLFTATLAALLLDRMPMAARLDGPRKLKAQTLPSAHLHEVERALRQASPKSLQAFHLRQVRAKRTLWQARVVGSAKRTAVPVKAKSQSPASTLRPWRLSSGKANPDEPLYAQRLPGVGSQAARLQGLAEERHQRLDLELGKAASYGGLSLDVVGSGAKNLLNIAKNNTVASGYAGVRIGRELTAPGSELALPTAMLFGMVGEFRAGVLRGVRLFYDKVPNQKDSVAGQAFYLGYDRFVVGYAFAWGLPCPSSLGRCQFTLAPKLGVWSVESRLPFVTPDQRLIAVPFETYRSLAYSYEVGLELERLFGLARVWHARDTSLPAVGELIPSTISSLRVGMDAVVHGPKLRWLGPSWRWSLLAFVFYEAIDIEGGYDPNTASLSLTQGGASGGKEKFLISLSSTFGGLGVSTSW